MGEKLFNAFFSAVVGGVTAIGVVWFLYEPPTSGMAVNAPAETAIITEKTKSAQPVDFPKVIDELEVRRLKVTEGIMVHHSASGEPLIELKDGVVLAKKEILSNYIGGTEMVGQKLRITTGDPSQTDPPVFCELATSSDAGAYLALLSPKGTHSVNLGFDKNETGFIISRNNNDKAMTAQAILPLPNKGNIAAIDDTPTDSSAPNQTGAVQIGAVPAAKGTSDRVAMSGQAGSESAPPTESLLSPAGGTSSLTPSATSGGPLPKPEGTSDFPSLPESF